MNIDKFRDIKKNFDEKEIEEYKDIKLLLKYPRSLDSVETTEFSNIDIITLEEIGGMYVFIPDRHNQKKFRKLYFEQKRIDNNCVFNEIKKIILEIENLETLIYAGYYIEELAIRDYENYNDKNIYLDKRWIKSAKAWMKREEMIKILDKKKYKKAVKYVNKTCGFY